MSDLPLVSLGVPVLNGENNIINVLESINRQTYNNLEVIVSDNHSTDRTSELVLNFIKDKQNFKYVRHERDMGTGWSFAEMIRLTHGKYFGWVAADTTIAPNFVKRLVLELLSDNTLIGAYPGVLLNDPNKHYSHFDNYELMQDSLVKRIEALYQNLAVGTMVYGLFDKKTMDELFVNPPPGFNRIYQSDRVFHFGDLQFLTFALMKGKILQVKEVLLNRNRENNNQNYIQYLGKLERYISNHISSAGLPCYIGLHEIMQRLYQSRISNEELMHLSKFIPTHIKQQFSSLFKQEAELLLDSILEFNLAKAWSDNYTIKNVELLECDADYISILKREKYRDLCIARLYSDDESILVAKELCEALL